MLDPLDADQIARAYSLGGDALISGPVARGEVGQVWKLTTDAGVFAVKEPFERPAWSKSTTTPRPGSTS
ncbi:MAG: hypothetical protein WAS51_04235 [Ilumatobacteraceae bacterium]